MEAMLLGFCLISLTLSSIIVAIELTRDRQRQKRRDQPKRKPKLPKSIQSPLKEISSPEKTTVAAPPMQKKTKVLDSLNHQLISLGYVSPKQQLGFINRVLKSQRTEIDDIDPNEIRHLFKVIRRYTGPGIAPDSTTITQPLVTQTPSNI